MLSIETAPTDVESLLSSGRVPLMRAGDDLGQRLQWALKHGAHRSQRALSLAAGLSQSYVGQIIRGDVKGQVAGDKLRALANAAGVSVEWLSFGTGAPQPGRTVALEEDPYASRPPVLALLQARGVPADIIAAVQSYRGKEGDPGTEHWFDLASTYMRGISKLAALDLPEEDAKFDEVPDI